MLLDYSPTEARSSRAVPVYAHCFDQGFAALRNGFSVIAGNLYNRYTLVHLLLGRPTCSYTNTFCRSAKQPSSEPQP